MAPQALVSMVNRVTLSMALLVAVGAHAQSDAAGPGQPVGVTTVSATDKLPKQFQALIDAGYAVSKRFDAGHGLIGWVLMRDGHASVVFSTADQQLVIPGAIIDSGGQNLSAQYLAQFTPKTDIKPLYDELGKATFIDEAPPSPARRLVYIIFDPNCPFCSTAWKSLRSYVASSVEVRWVPVAYLQANSAARVAAILGAKDPAAALASNEEGFKTETHQGGIEPSTSFPENVSRALRTNDDLMTRLGSNATPTFVWLDDHGEAQSYVGLPPPIKMLEIVGLAPSGSSPP